jgi:GTP-binding protein
LKDEKIVKAKISNLENSVHVTTDLERVTSKVGALEYIKADEYVEVTPKSMRMRKVILDELERKRANKE